MTETRSQLLLKETVARKTSAAVRETEEALGTKMDQMLNRTQALEETVAKQNKKIDQHIADMFVAIKMLPNNQASSSNTLSQERGFLAVSLHRSRGITLWIIEVIKQCYSQVIRVLLVLAK